VNFLLKIVPWPRQLVAGLTIWRLGFKLRTVHVKFVVNKVAKGQVTLQSFCLRCQYQPTNIPHSALSTRCSYHRQAGVKPGKLSRSKCTWEMGEQWIAGCVHFLCHLQMLKPYHTKQKTPPLGISILLVWVCYVIDRIRIVCRRLQRHRSTLLDGTKCSRQCMYVHECMYVCMYNS